MLNLSDTSINDRARAYLIAYRDALLPIAGKFFTEQKNRAGAISPHAEEMIRIYENFFGGKTLRGALAKLGYELFGGTDTTEIIKASLVVEIIHSFALIHDDIMDEDMLRRGEPTVHIQYENAYDQRYKERKRNKKLFGTSMAINVGDFGAYFANIIIEQTAFPPELKLRFLKHLSEVLINTIIGQGLDVTYEQEGLPTEEKVLQIHRYKTAYYTIPGPLKYGALLAGIAETDPRMHAIEQYGIPLGIAFQLRDDELGMFSSPEKLGKPTTSDLRQGKNTLLFAKAFEQANPEQREVLEHLHGNPYVTQQDVAKINDILIATGALEYSKAVSRAHVEEGKKYIPAITPDPAHQEILSIIADFTITRNS